MPWGRVIQWPVCAERSEPVAAIPAAPQTAEVVHLWGEPWSAEKVKSRLVEAFDNLPGRAIFARSHGDFDLIVGEHVGHIDLISFAENRLDASDYRLLMRWASCESKGDKSAWLAWCEALGLTPKRCGERVTRKAGRLGKMLGDPNDERARRVSLRLKLSTRLDNAEP